MTNRGSKNIAVTGGTGFIGSALVPLLLREGNHVTIIDHSPYNKIQKWEYLFPLDNFEYVQVDLLEANVVKQILKNCDVIFHLAANVDVRKGPVNTEIDFLNNIVATRNVLESMRFSNKCKRIVFTSSSVVYGEHPTMPTSESSGPLNPISVYGATKLACEALISGYVGTFGIEAVIFRLANVVGPHSRHGVIFDFFKKLKESDGEYLEILGDGKQKKSYLYIDDCINALMLGLDEFRSPLEIFNVGSDDQIDTNTIAQIIIDEMALRPQITHCSGSKDGGGWPGDVKNMLLSIDKIKKIGWKLTYSSKQAVTLTARSIIENEYKKGTSSK